MNLKELYRALADGKIIEHPHHGKVYIFNNKQIDYDTKSQTNCAFKYSEEWSIYEKPDWREALNGKRTLGYVRDNTIYSWSKDVFMCFGYDADRLLPFKVGEETYFKYFKPCTLEEIEEFKNNVPEAD